MLEWQRMPVAVRNNRPTKEKLPLFLVSLVVAFVVIIIFLEILEDTLIEGGSATAPIAEVMNTIFQFTQNVTGIVQSWGYVGLFVLMALEASSVPIPSEVILPFAGYLVSQALMDFWLANLVATVAGVFGSVVDYWIGLKGMGTLIRNDTLRSLLYNRGRMDTAQRWFDKYGAWAVFLSRLVPGFRTWVSFPAGAVKMPLTRFIAYTTVGCVLWDTVLIYIGVVVGSNWRSVAGVAHYLIIVTAVAVLIALALFLIRRRKKSNLSHRVFVAEAEPD